MTGQSGCLPPLCSGSGEGRASCTSFHLQPSSFLFWQVSVPPGVLVARSPEWADWWREVHQESSTDSSLTDTAWAWWLLHLVCCDAFNPALVSHLTMVPSHGPCWIRICSEDGDFRSHFIAADWNAAYSLNLVLPEILSKSDGFITLAHSSPSRRDL